MNRNDNHGFGLGIYDDSVLALLLAYKRIMEQCKFIQILEICPTTEDYSKLPEVDRSQIDQGLIDFQAELAALVDEFWQLMRNMLMVSSIWQFDELRRLCMQFAMTDRRYNKPLTES